MDETLNSNELSFFRDTTLKICSNLNLARTLNSCFATISAKIPAYGMFVSQYHPDENTFHILAMVTIEGTIELDHRIKIAPEYHDFALWEETSNIKIVDSVEEEPVSREIAKALHPHLQEEDVSFLVMRLELKDRRRIADVCLFAKGRKQFDLSHARLFRMLNEPFAIAFANFISYRNLHLANDRLSADNRYLREEISHLQEGELIGSSPGMIELKNLVRHVAPMEATVLLTGETGVGKEVVANTIQKRSGRCIGPFIKVNCGAIPEGLIDSELFGHEKGAFTGAARQRKGRFELADGGTIFLDEVGEMPLAAQVRLLRVLQDGVFERVGGIQPVHVDIRIIAATHRDLPELTRLGKFRQDLFFRLNVFPIHIPPLRERKKDIPLLVDKFIKKISEKMGRPEPVLADACIQALLKSQWPGNVRELENIVERALIVHRAGPLNLPTGKVLPFQNIVLKKETGSKPIAPLNAVIIQHIENALRLSKGKIQGKGGAAELLDIKPNTLRKRMQKLGIPYGRRMKKEKPYL